jgi:hypothetical protein
VLEEGLILKKKYNRIISTFKITFKSIPLLWKCDPFSSTLLVVILLIQGTVPLGTIWIIKSIINQITLSITNKLILVSVFSNFMGVNIIS